MSPHRNKTVTRTMDFVFAKGSCTIIFRNEMFFKFIKKKNPPLCLPISKMDSFWVYFLVCLCALN